MLLIGMLLFESNTAIETASSMQQAEPKVSSAAYVKGDGGRPRPV